MSNAQIQKTLEDFRKETREDFKEVKESLEQLNGRLRDNEQATGRHDERINNLERDMTAQKWTERAISMISAAIAAAVGVFVKSP